ncbi:MAG: hypothetical protein R3E48_06220 [Burkholderiaceae bacterium]
MFDPGRDQASGLRQLFRADVSGDLRLLSFAESGLDRFVGTGLVQALRRRGVRADLAETTPVQGDGGGMRVIFDGAGPADRRAGGGALSVLVVGEAAPDRLASTYAGLKRLADAGDLGHCGLLLGGAGDPVIAQTCRRNLLGAIDRFLGIHVDDWGMVPGACAPARIASTRTGADDTSGDDQVIRFFDRAAARVMRGEPIGGAGVHTGSGFRH